MTQEKTRTKELARRTFVYTLMVVTMISGLIFLMFNMLGYTFNSNTSQLQQTGLVQYTSYPSGAMVSVDGMELRRTQAKHAVLPGIHTFSMKLDDYEPWQKTLEIKSNTVTNIDYVRMIPIKRTVSAVKTFDNIQAAYLSPAGNFVAGIGQKDKTPVATFGDIRDTNNEKFKEYALSTEVLAGYAWSADGHSFMVSEWDKDARYLLVKHIYRGEDGAQDVQWLRLDRENPEKIVDITAITGFDIKQAHFVGTSGNELYVLQESGELRHVNVDGSAISSPIITGVESFKLYGTDRLAYVAADSSKGKKIAGIWKKDWKKPFVIRTFTADESPIIRVSGYFNKDTVVLGAGKRLTIYRGDISDSKEAQAKFLKTDKTLQLDGSIEDISLNNSGRFIVAQIGSSAQSYDLERSTLSSKFQLGDGQKIKWLDDFHLLAAANSGKTAIQEYDGTNFHELLPADKKIGIVLSSNQRYVYALAADASGKLVLSKMNMTNGSVGWFGF